AQAAHGVIGACFYCLVDFSVGVGFVLAFVPSEAAEGAQVLSDLLLGVVAKAIFQGAEVLVGEDVGRGVDAREIGAHGFAIDAHVGVVGVEEDARGALAAGQE